MTVILIADECIVTRSETKLTIHYDGNVLDCPTNNYRIRARLFSFKAELSLTQFNPKTGYEIDKTVIKTKRLVMRAEGDLKKWTEEME